MKRPWESFPACFYYVINLEEMTRKLPSLNLELIYLCILPLGHKTLKSILGKKLVKFRKRDVKVVAIMVNYTSSYKTSMRGQVRHPYR